MLNIQKAIEIGEGFVNESLLNSNRAWSPPIQIVEIDGRKYEICFQSKLIGDEYGPINN